MTDPAGALATKQDGGMGVPKASYAKDVLEGASEFWQLHEHLTWPEQPVSAAQRDAATVLAAWEDVGKDLALVLLDATKSYHNLNQEVGNWMKARFTMDETIQLALGSFREVWVAAPTFRRWLASATSAMDAAQATATSFKAIEAAIADLSSAPRNVSQFTDAYEASVASLRVINDVLERVQGDPTVIAAVNATIESAKRPDNSDTDRDGSAR